jgi:hypothetical protein
VTRVLAALIAVALVACSGSSTPDGRPDGVNCLAAGVCPVGDMCCHLTAGGNTCQPVNQACNGSSFAACDGPEDCGDTTPQCCEHPNGTAICWGVGFCDGRVVCHTDADCSGQVCCDPPGPARVNGYRYCTAGAACPL